MTGEEADPRYAGHSVDERKVRGQMKRNQRKMMKEANENNQ